MCILLSVTSDDGGVGEGGGFRAARTTWTLYRTGGGGSSGIPSLLPRRRISLRRQSPPPTLTTHSVAVDSHITHTSSRPPKPKPTETARQPTLLSGHRRTSSSPLPDRRERRFSPWSGHRWPSSWSWACTPCSTRARSHSTVSQPANLNYYFLVIFDFVPVNRFGTKLMNSPSLSLEQPFVSFSDFSIDTYCFCTYENRVWRT